MLKRTITAVVMTLVLVPFFWFSTSYPFLIPILMGLLSGIAAFELYRCIGKHKDYLATIPGYLIALGLPFVTYFFEDLSTFALVALAVLSLYILYLFSLAVIREGAMNYASVGTIFGGTFYIACSFASFCLLRHQTKGGEYLFLLVFFGAWITDMFAYFAGRLFGRHKLIPKVSPKKTVEGSIGGILFCMLSFVGFGLVMEYAYGKTVHYVMLLVCGLICSIVSQFGDLLMSLIKREHGIKDYGNLFPGHGGVLDRFDSILAISPVMCILANLSLVWDSLQILS